jgi:hypothetical protein
LVQSASCLYPMHSTWMACWHCWNNITSLTPNCVKLSCLCLTLKGSKALETFFQKCFLQDFRSFQQCVFCVTSLCATILTAVKDCALSLSWNWPRWVCWQWDVEDSTQGLSPETARASSWWPKVWKARVLKSSFVWLANVVINLFVSLALINCKSNDNFYIAHISIPRMLTALGYTSKCIEAVPAEDSNPSRRRANLLLFPLYCKWVRMYTRIEGTF